MIGKYREHIITPIKWRKMEDDMDTQWVTQSFTDTLCVINVPRFAPRLVAIALRRATAETRCRALRLVEVGLFGFAFPAGVFAPFLGAVIGGFFASVDLLESFAAVPVGVVSFESTVITSFAA